MGAYLHGVRLAARHWPLVIGWGAATLLCGVVFTAVSWSWLDTALDRSLATRTLLAELDVNVFVDLFTHHGESLRMLAAMAGMFALLFVLAGVWLNAAAVAMVAFDARFIDAARRGLSAYGVFLRLLLIAASLDFAAIAGGWLLGRYLTRWTVESPSEMTYYWCIFAAAGFTALVLFVVTTVHDHARVYSVAADRRAAAAFVWAFGFVVRTPATWAVTLLLLASGGAGWWVYHSIADRIAPTSVVGLVISLAWAQAFMLLRMYLRVTRFGAVVQLQSTRSVHS